MRKVIVNSTPLIILGKLNLLDLLKDIYEEVYIPEAVLSEVTKKNDIAKERISEANWIHIEPIRNVANKRMYAAKLHDGEVEVMILAQEHEGKHLVIIDDDAARKTAIFLGLELTGTIGVLIKAKELGLLNEVMPIVEEMERHKIFLSDDLKARVRRIAKE